MNDLIHDVKKLFVKAPSRVRFFKELCPNLSLPPEPIITRWGTWLAAVIYYADNFDSIRSVLEKLDSKDAVAIKKAKEVIVSANIKRHLNLIKFHFAFLLETITTLQAGLIKLKESWI